MRGIHEGLDVITTRQSSFPTIVVSCCYIVYCIIQADAFTREST